MEKQLLILLNELKTYDSSLLEKSIWIAINKRDTLDEKKRQHLIDLIRNKIKSLKLNIEDVVSISGFTGDETKTLLGMIAKKMSDD